MSALATVNAVDTSWTDTLFAGLATVATSAATTAANLGLAQVFKAEAPRPAPAAAAPAPTPGVVAAVAVRTEPVATAAPPPVAEKGFIDKYGELLLVAAAAIAALKFLK